jgi:serine protease Do
MRRRSGKVLGILLAAILGGVAGGLAVRALDRAGGPGGPGSPAAGVRPYTQVVEIGQPAAAGEAVVQVVQKVGPAVVNIDALSRGAEAFGYPFQQEVRQGQGSGFIINGKEGLVVTNNHVVERAEQIRVTLSDKRSLPATVVGTDPIGDIALLRVRDGGNLPEVPFGDSDQLQIGQLVVAIGNPLGFDSSVTQGVLSQIGRRLDGNIQGMPLEDLIQTDAAINPGNSGGPLLDAYGRVIGMNTAIISRAQGIGFAVASNTVKRAVEDILQHGRVIRPWVGVTMGEVSPEIAQQAGLPERAAQAVVIVSVRRGEPAERAGLRRRDVVTEANGAPVTGVDELRGVIRGLRPGDRLTLKGFRGDEAQTWEITVGRMPSPEELMR